MTLTGPHPRFRSLHRQSVPGSRINEDGAGLHGRFAWILDGATGVSTEQLAVGSDAAWLVGVADGALKELAGAGQSIEEILSSLEAQVEQAFDRATAHLPDRQDHHAPSACLGLIGVQSTGNGELALQGRFLGDVVALVPSGEGVVRWTDERAKPFEKKTLAALGTAGHESGRMPEAVRRQILENRSRLNHPEGYWVVNARRSWAGHELRFEARVRAGEPVVLATDGFMRLVDVFKVYTDSALHARLAAGGGVELMQELRELERGDLMADAYPRVKTHDDATVLVIAAEPHG